MLFSLRSTLSIQVVLNFVLIMKSISMGFSQENKVYILCPIFLFTTVIPLCCQWNLTKKEGSNTSLCSRSLKSPLLRYWENEKENLKENRRFSEISEWVNLGWEIILMGNFSKKISELSHTKHQRTRSFKFFLIFICISSQQCDYARSIILAQLKN